MFVFRVRGQHHFDKVVLYLVIDGVGKPLPPFAFLPAAGIRWDNEKEFHFFQNAKDGIYLVCAGIDQSVTKRNSTCHRKARGLYRKK